MAEKKSRVGNNPLDWIKSTVENEDKNTGTQEVKITLGKTKKSDTTVNNTAVTQTKDIANQNNPYFLITISAKSQDVLNRRFMDLKEWLEEEGAKCSIGDIACTLLSGRSHFSVRVALIAKDAKDLYRKVESICANGSPEDYFSAKQQSKPPRVDASVKSLFGSLVVDLNSTYSDTSLESLRELARLYVEGYDLEWDRVYPKDNFFRVSMPTYPFKEDRYWVPEVEQGSVASGGTFGQHEKLHNVIDKNMSTLEEQCFSKRFSGEEFYFKDHVVGKDRILPGVVYLEMARVAGELSEKGMRVSRIKDVIWTRPIKLTGEENSSEVLISLYPGENEIEYEVTSMEDGERVVHGQGAYIYSNLGQQPALDIINVEEIKKRCPNRISGEECYEKFRKHGLNLGPSFQSIKEMFANNMEAVSYIELPQHLRQSFREYGLHPIIMDGALETVIGLVSSEEKVEGAVALPYSLGELEIYGELPEKCYSFARRTLHQGMGDDTQVFEVLVADEQGRVVCKMKDFVLKLFFQVSRQEQAAEKLYYKGFWEAQELDGRLANQITGNILIFTGEDSFYQSLKKVYGSTGKVMAVKPGKSFAEVGELVYEIDPASKEDYKSLVRALSDKKLLPNKILFMWNFKDSKFKLETVQKDIQNSFFPMLHLSQALMDTKPSEAIQLLYAIKGSCEEVNPSYAAMSAFAKTVRQENSKFAYRILRIDSAAKTEEVLKYAILEFSSEDARTFEVLYEGGKRTVRKYKEFSLDAEVKSSVQLRDKGVYIITGGMGGLGLIFARYLAEKVKARLVLTGRSEQNGSIDAEIKKLEALGAQVMYLKADVTSSSDMEKLVSKAKSKFNTINGVIHSAGITQDAYVVNKTQEQAEQVMAPKILGTINLDIATQKEELDFFVMFSSIAALTGNSGQCDYAYGNSFMDYYAVHRQNLAAASKRQGKTISINWSLWKDGGMKVDEQTLTLFRNTVGVKPLEIETGVKAFEKGLGLDLSQFLVVEGERRKIERMLGIEEVVEVKASVSSDGSSEAELFKKIQTGLMEIVQGILKIKESDIGLDSEMSEYGFNSITLTDFTNGVNKKYSLSITPAIFFEYPTLRAFAKHLFNEYRDVLAQQIFENKSSENTVVVETQPTFTLPQVKVRNRFRTKGENGPVAKTSRYKDEPIAIIGMDGIMPGSEDLEALWENLINQRDLISEVPKDRWDWEALNNSVAKNSEKVISKWGGFMREVDKFDNMFFGISPREADMMDPQQRIFLEVVWRTIEDAGYKASDLSGSKTGLFVGVSTSDYSDLMRDYGIEIEAYSSTGISHCVLANRISYLLNFHGPSEPIDTACSSSLIAIHRGVESIRNGDCELAIAGGINVMMSPLLHISFSRAGMLSPDGRCKTFDKRANGYVRGEGAGAILLKPLSKAEADGDNIYAVIKGSAVNHGGHVSSLTAPNPNAQAELIINAYERAGFDPDTLSYIEAHGTGTNLGDPVEVNGLKNAFKELYNRKGKTLPAEGYCGLGTIKTNIGHLEAAAGIAGILKVLLSFKNKKLPGIANFKELNPYVDIKKSPFYIVENTKEWEPLKDGEGRVIPRRAGVSSFGFGGANAHIALEEHDNRVAVETGLGKGPRLIVLSAKSMDRLKEKARQLKKYLENIVHNETNDGTSLYDIAYTLQAGREAMEERLAFVADNIEDAVGKLGCFIYDTTDTSELHIGKVRKAKNNSEDLEALKHINSVVESGNLREIAKLWIEGNEIEWQLLYRGRRPRRLHLPSYPFAKDRCWLKIPSEANTIQMQGTAGFRSSLHPMVDVNESTLEEEKFRKTFRADEFFLRDHIVGGRILLPGVAYLEMIRAAAELAGIKPVYGISNVLWVEPIALDKQTHDVFISLYPDGGRISYEIYSFVEDRRVIHSQGNILRKPENPSVPNKYNIEELKRRFTETKEKDECYQKIFKGVGFDYGPSFRVTERAYLGETEGLARICLPAEFKSTFSQFILHPSIMDGSVRALSWVGQRSDKDLVLRIPFALGEMEIFKPLTENCYAYATLVQQAGSERGDDSGARKYNISILNDDGEELVRIKGFAIKLYKERKQLSEAKESQDSRLYYYKPALDAVPLAASSVQENGNTVKTVLVLGDESIKRELLEAKLKAVCPQLNRIITVRKSDSFKELGENEYLINAGEEEHYKLLFSSLSQKGTNPTHILHLWNMGLSGVDLEGNNVETLCSQVENHLDNGLYSLLYLFKAVTAQNLETKTKCMYLFNGSAQTPAPQHEVLAAFAKSHTAVNFRFELVSLQLESNTSEDELTNVVVSELLAKDNGNGTELAYINGERHKRRIHKLDIPESSSKDSIKLKEGGVYLIPGGSGGLGMVFAKYLAQKFHARLILTGRSEADNSIEEKLQELRELGGEAYYVKADVFRIKDAVEAVQAAKEKFNRIDGILHCAGIGDDIPVTKADKSTFGKILSSKVYGTMNLDFATRNEKLDFFVMFSSISVEIGDLGACSYATANSFMDRYAAVRETLRGKNKRYGKTLSINWPLWSGGKFSIPEEQAAFYFEHSGMRTMDAELGITAFEEMLKTGETQIITAAGNPEKISKVLKVVDLSKQAESGVPPLSQDNTHVYNTSEQEAAASSQEAYSGDRLFNETASYLRELLSKTINLPASRIDPEAPFEKFGIDSIMIMELNSQLNKDFEGLSKTLFYEYNTLQDLTKYFTENFADRIIEIRGLDKKQAAVPEKAQSTTVVVNTPVNKPVSSKSRFVQLNQNREYGFADRAMIADEDIAIIGLDGRFPKAGNLDEFWVNLVNGRDCITEIPIERWDYREDYDPQKGKKGKIYTKYGGFIDDVDKFDPMFFQMTPRDAELTDPQERLFLESVYHTMEDSGYTRASLADSKVGVFVGVMYGHYQIFGAEEYLRGNPVVANSIFASIANRVSYFFNFHGPSVAVDTMCSSSLTALHLACESIRRGDSDVAIAGGVNVTIHRSKYFFLCQQRFASSEGKCRAFGDGGDGYVAGEGVGAVLLKPLRKALEDGDRIYAVVKGTSVNHGGKTSSYTVPSPNAQGELILDAIKKSDINPRTISYLEAHGTGTSLGDPIEITGLTKAFQPYTKDKQFCSIGSVKTNVGHLESAAGIASIAKVLLQFKYKKLVPSIHSDTLNPNISFEDSAFYVQRNLDEWKRPVIIENGVEKEYPRRVGISSFGAGGANVHVIMEEYDGVQEDGSLDIEGPKLFIFSAKNANRLLDKAVQFKAYLENSIEESGEGALNLTNIAYTLQVGREEMEERLAIVASDAQELIEKLDSYISNKNSMDSVYFGNVEHESNAGLLLGRDQEDQEYIAALINKGSYDKLAKLWVAGNAVDWERLYKGYRPLKVSLPLYPFARESYWLTITEDKSVQAVVPASGSGSFGPLHPLVDTNISTLKEQKFKKVLGTEEFFLRDHVVSGQILLPGVAYLEMARAAGEIAGESAVRVISDVMWIKPIIMNEPKKDVYTVIRPQGSHIAYEVYSNENGQHVTHSQGRISYKYGPAGANRPTPRLFDINDIKSRCPVSKGREECYNRIFKGIGFDYGPSFQVTDEVLSGNGETLAKLSLSQAYRNTLSGFVLHPALLDGAVRAVAAGDDGEGRATHIPFALGKMEIFRSIPAECYIYSVVKQEAFADEQVARRFDISILDENGEEIIRITDFAVRPYKEKKLLQSPDQNGQELLYYKAGWEEAALSEDTMQGSKTVLVFDDRKDLYQKLEQELRQRFDQCDKVVFVSSGSQYEEAKGNSFTIDPTVSEHYVKLVKKLGSSGIVPTHILHMWNIGEDKTGLSELENLKDAHEQLDSDMDSGLYSIMYLFKAVTEMKWDAAKIRCLFVFGGDEGQMWPQHEVISGFAKSITTINHRFELVTMELKGRTMDTPQVIQRVLGELMSGGNSNGTEIRYENEKRLVRKLSQIDVSSYSENEDSILPKQGGVYLIPGGAGALGMIFARNLAKNYNAKLVLSGRSAAGKDTQDKISELVSLGGEAIYVQADISRTEDVIKLVQAVKNKFHRLDGIIHCAGRAEDTPVTKADRESFGGILGSKVQGVLDLDLATKDEDLDFFVMFSSVSVEMGDLGACSYAVANSFMDRYAALREQYRQEGKRSGRTLSINWPLWSGGGFEIPESEATFYFEFSGMRTMDEQSGLEAFEKACSSGLSQILIAKGDLNKINKALKVDRGNKTIDMLRKLGTGELSVNDVKQLLGVV